MLTYLQRTMPSAMLAIRGRACGTFRGGGDAVNVCAMGTDVNTIDLGADVNCPAVNV